MKRAGTSRPFSVEPCDLHLLLMSLRSAIGLFFIAFLNASVSVAQPPPPPYGSGLKLNEAQSINTQTIADPNGLFSGWLEIFNTTANQFALGFMFLTDDPAQLTKHRIVDSPSMLVSGHEHMLLWADGDTAQGPDHLNFTLNPNGGWVYFTSPDGESVIDSVQYPAMGSDESYGRDGDGNASWIIFPTPTPDAPNIFSSVRNDIQNSLLPEHQVVRERIHFYGSAVEIIDWAGRRIGTVKGLDGVFDVSSLPSGSYIARTEDGKHFRFMKM